VFLVSSPTLLLLQTGTMLASCQVVWQIFGIYTISANLGWLVSTAEVPTPAVEVLAAAWEAGTGSALL
jgi:hypothetical protein